MGRLKQCGAWLLIAALTVGCATVSKEHQQDQLDQSLFAFERAIRWGEFETANGFRRGQPGEIISFEHLRDIRVTSYDVTGRSVAQDKKSAAQTVEIRYYRPDVGVERTATHRQQWQYDEGAKRWFLEGAMPEFR